MHVPSRYLMSMLTILVALGVAASLAPTSQAARANARCTASQATVVIDGTRSCRARGSVRQIASKSSDATWAANRIFGLAGVRPVQPALKPGGKLVPTRTPAEARRIVAVTAQAEAVAKAAALDALDPKKSRHGAPTPRAAGDVTFSTPVTTVTQTANSMQANAQISATVDLGEGKSTKVSLDLDARRSGDAEAVFKVGLDFEHQDGAGVTTNDGTRMQLLGGKYDTCPSINGEIRYTMPASTQSHSRLAEKLGPINLGYVNRDSSTKSSSKATVVMNADATLPAIPFSITVTSKQSFDARLLNAIRLGKHSYTAVATARGTVDPKTGMPSASTVFDVRTVGGGSSNDAATRAALARDALTESRELIGKLVTHFRKVEKSARDGECTRLDFTPGSGATLAPKATQRVDASLRSKANSGAQIPVPVTWTVKPSLGSVTPTTGKVNSLPTTVTAADAAKGGTTARVTYKAVSRAGISTGDWLGVATSYPTTYAGTFSYDENLGGITNEHREASVTYTLSKVTDGPDGSTQLWYGATAANVTAASYTDTFGGVAAITLGTNRIIAGDVEILISPAGAWTGAMQIDIDMGTHTITYPAPIPPSTPTFKTLFNSRIEAAVPQLRAMDARGPITGSTTFDGSGRTGSGTWNLTPSG